MRTTRMVAAIALVGAISLIGPSPASARPYEEIEVSGGASVEGRVYFKNETPPAERIRPSRDNDVCGIRIASEVFVVDGDSKGLANVVVKIEGVAKGKAFSASESQLSQVKCRYEPHLMVVRPGRKIEITNGDPILHNVHAYRGDDTVFNMAQPFQGQKTPQILKDEGLVRVACDVHDWMEAWVVVIDNPYVAITDSQGRFKIEDLPPGDYKITMWHERLGSATKEVSAKAGETSKIDFSIGK